MSKTTWEFSAEDISEILTINKKTFGYLKNTLSRFFLQVNKEGLSFYFKDTAGLMRYTKKLTYVTPPIKEHLVALDFQKVVNSLLRFQVQGALINLTDASLSIVDRNNSTTVVKLSASASADDLDAILQEKEKEKGNLIKYLHTAEMNRTFGLTSKLMSNGNPNNCLAIVDGNTATYADRSVIYKEKCNTDFKEPLVTIHSFLVGFIANTYSLPKAEYYFDFANNALYFKSDEVTAFLLSEQPDINMPSADDLEEIRPSNKTAQCNVVKISAIELSESLDFFEGFFERDVWKPIKFQFSKKEQKLSYTSPVTSVEKPFASNFNISFETEFTLTSTPLQAILSNILEDGNDVEITLIEKPNMPGVSVKVDDQDFELVLAKLNF